MTLQEAANVLELKSVKQVQRLLESGELQGTWEKYQKDKKRWTSAVAESVYKLANQRGKKIGNAEIAEHKATERREEKRTADDIDLSKLAADLRLNREQTDRLYASASIPKKRAEAILKAEQAFERQNKNLLQSKNLVSLEELEEQHERIYAFQFRNLKDLIESYVTEFQLTPEQAAKARKDFENVMRRICDELRAIAK